MPRDATAVEVWLGGGFLQFDWPYRRLVLARCLVHGCHRLPFYPSTPASPVVLSRVPSSLPCARRHARSPGPGHRTRWITLPSCRRSDGQCALAKPRALFLSVTVASDGPFTRNKVDWACTARNEPARKPGQTHQTEPDTRHKTPLPLLAPPGPAPKGSHPGPSSCSPAAGPSP